MDEWDTRVCDHHNVSEKVQISEDKQDSSVDSHYYLFHDH